MTATIRGVKISTIMTRNHVKYHVAYEVRIYLLSGRVSGVRGRGLPVTEAIHFKHN